VWRIRHGGGGDVLAAGGPPFDFLDGTAEKGCRALAFFARAGTMLFGLGDFHEIKLGAVGCIVPTLRKEREEWGTHFVFCAGSLKAGPPALGVFCQDPVGCM